MSNLKELVEIVRASRERTNGVFPLPEYAGKYHRSMTEVECEAVLLTACNAQKMRRWESAGQGRLL